MDIPFPGYLQLYAVCGLSKKNAPKRDIRFAESSLPVPPAGLNAPSTCTDEKKRFDAGCHVTDRAHAQQRFPTGRRLSSIALFSVRECTADNRRSAPCLRRLIGPMRPFNCGKVGNPPRLSAFLFRRAPSPDAEAPRKEPMMYDRERWPEQRASTGLPVGIMLLSALAITAYLAVGGAFSDGGDRAVVYIPQTIGK